MRKHTPIRLLEHPLGRYFLYMQYRMEYSVQIDISNKIGKERCRHVNALLRAALKLYD